ncbi:hypothetical protein LASUN_03840 [Lentilactobacillus sunkii]|uniref:Uncharacterized protein n=1 Tax=Lentilactobacillus sunkii TaxID=481719 RepID=A0A1E7XIE1_9LACO|nr:hypothetical protein LASUN_03840 [Lentilactobacillus sunkii]
MEDAAYFVEKSISNKFVGEHKALTMIIIRDPDL